MKRWVVVGAVLVGLFAALVAAGALLPESPDRMTGSLTNPRPQGVRALGQVLGADGVVVRQVTTLDAATAAADTGSTLAVYLSEELSDAAVARLNAVPADLVVVFTGTSDLVTVDALSDERIVPEYWWADSDGVAATCSDPDATAAGTLSSSAYWGVRARTNLVTVCFPAQDDESGLYADTSLARHRVTVIAGDAWLQNDTITRNGNAALALRVFGRHENLTWYLPGADALAPVSQGDGGTLDAWSLLPPWSRAVLAVLAVAGAAAALWRGRRFGGLVRERLPVEVPASEVSSGLARLYRQSGARGHAAAGLRATTLHRVAARLGVPASASPELVVERLAQASGDPPDRLRALCYGPPPPTDADLVALATALADLERKLTNRE